MHLALLTFAASHLYTSKRIVSLSMRSSDILNKKVGLDSTFNNNHHKKSIKSYTRLQTDIKNLRKKYTRSK